MLIKNLTTKLFFKSFLQNDYFNFFFFNNRVKFWFLSIWIFYLDKSWPSYIYYLDRFRLFFFIWIKKYLSGSKTGSNYQHQRWFLITFYIRLVLSGVEIRKFPGKFVINFWNNYNLFNIVELELRVILYYVVVACLVNNIVLNPVITC